MEDRMLNASFLKQTLTVGVVAVLSLSGSAFAAKKSKKELAAEKAQMEAMMVQAIKNGSPNANHQVFAGQAGKWTFGVKHWMKPGDKPMESQGTSEHELVFGGRFLKQMVHGNFNGQPFEGLAYLGYDNVRGQYESIWMDNMMTGIMKIAGPYDAASKTIRGEGTYSCPMTGNKDLWARTEWVLTDNNNSVYSSYSKDDKGQEFKSMEITYKRIP